LVEHAGQLLQSLLIRATHSSPSGSRNAIVARSFTSSCEFGTSGVRESKASICSRNHGPGLPSDSRSIRSQTFGGSLRPRDSNASVPMSFGIVHGIVHVRARPVKRVVHDGVKIFSTLCSVIERSPGQIIAEARGRQGWSQTELAARMH